MRSFVMEPMSSSDWYYFILAILLIAVATLAVSTGPRVTSTIRKIIAESKDPLGYGD